MKNERTLIHSGTTTLVMILSVLALVVFSVLSLSAANVYKKQVGQLAERSEEYYRAEEEASLILKKLSEELRKSELNDGEKNRSEIMEAVADSVPEVSLQQDRLYFEVPSGEGQCLAVLVEAVFSQTNERLPYRIVEWKVKNTEEWKAENSRNYLGNNE